jgi:hypothetical protein
MNSEYGNPIWVVKFWKIMFGRTDALDEGWHYHGKLRKFCVVFPYTDEETPLNAGLVIGKRLYMIFFNYKNKSGQ